MHITHKLFTVIIFLSITFFALLVFKAFRTYSNLEALKIECKQKSGEVIKYHGDSVCAKVEILQGTK